MNLKLTLIISSSLFLLACSGSQAYVKKEEGRSGGYVDTPHDNNIHYIALKMPEKQKEYIQNNYGVVPAIIAETIDKPLTEALYGSDPINFVQGYAQCKS